LAGKLPVLGAEVQAAHGDAWEAEGRLRERVGGGALALRGLRVMATGLPHPQWNSGDVSDADADLEGARAFYAERGVPWGVRVPAGLPWRHGRHLLHKRLMALTPARFRPALPSDATIRAAGPEDLDAVLHIDCTAFTVDPDLERRWLAPHLTAPRIDVALAELDGEPVGTAYALHSDGRAGACLYVAGVGVLPEARRRGVAAAMSSWLLARGLSAGAQLAHLSPDHDAAARIYGRLGFTEAPGFDIYVDLW
jgi:ribosomal protein S18 acetylase RimI-like enzyme